MNKAKIINPIQIAFICFKKPDYFSHFRALKIICIYKDEKMDMWELSSAARTFYCWLLGRLWVSLLARRHLGSPQKEKKKTPFNYLVKKSSSSTS